MLSLPAFDSRRIPSATYPRWALRPQFDSLPTFDSLGSSLLRDAARGSRALDSIVRGTGYLTGSAGYILGTAAAVFLTFPFWLFLFAARLTGRLSSAVGVSRHSLQTGYPGHDSGSRHIITKPFSVHPLTAVPDDIIRPYPTAVPDAIGRPYRTVVSGSNNLSTPMVGAATAPEEEGTSVAAVRAAAPASSDTNMVAGQQLAYEQMLRRAGKATSRPAKQPPQRPLRPVFRMPSAEAIAEANARAKERQTPIQFGVGS